MNYIFLIAAFNAIFFSILLLQKKPREFHDNILISWLLYLGIFIAIYSFYSHGLFTHFYLLSISFISLFLLQGIFLYIYVLALIQYKKKINKRNFLHLVPFLLFNLYLLIISFFPEISKSIRLDYTQIGINPPFLFIIFLIITLLSGPLYFLFSLRLLKKHDINLFNNFSFSENINLKWLRYLVFIFGLIWTALIIITVIHHIFNLFSMAFCTDGLFLSLSVLVILIGYFGLKQKVIFSNDFKNEQNLLIESKIKYSGSLLKDSESEQYIDRINNLMVSSKPFLDPNLTLPQLANKLDISTHYLSQIINEKFHLNFFNFINQYRVEEVKVRINDLRFENYSLLGIALDSGFNSKSSFNRIFKNFTNQTPSQYKSDSIKP